VIIEGTLTGIGEIRGPGFGAGWANLDISEVYEPVFLSCSVIEMGSGGGAEVGPAWRPLRVLSRQCALFRFAVASLRPGAFERR
jgi:hypothetical protein